VRQRQDVDIDIALLDMPKEMAKLIEQKYVSRMTMNEIGEANGYSRETARRRLKKAVEYYKST
jgi:DNA-directed RNA polymerase specialized sigma24 family protein